MLKSLSCGQLVLLLLFIIHTSASRGACGSWNDPAAPLREATCYGLIRACLLEPMQEFIPKALCTKRLGALCLEGRNLGGD